MNNSKNILIDIQHPAQLNFFKNAIKQLSKKHSIYVTYVSRGKLQNIMDKELGNIKNCKLIKIGNHRNTMLSVIVEINLIRPILLFLQSSIINPEIVLSCGYQAGIYPKLAGIPSIHFSDDLEKGSFFIGLVKFVSQDMYYPFFSDEKIKPFAALKEWSYLSPKYFTPNRKVLEELGVKEKEYIFVREVSINTFNYRKQQKGIIESLSTKFPKDIPVILSLEDKDRQVSFPDHWIILDEPVEDIHSILYFSKYVISSGDSMAREGAQLGVPSFYCGIRKMHSNEILINKRLLFQVNSRVLLNIISPFLKSRGNKEFLKTLQLKIRQNLNMIWEDITDFISEKVENY